jgi:hypothetical protein
MKPNDTPYPVAYLGASLSRKMFVLIRPPMLPAARVHAKPIDRFYESARLLPVQGGSRHDDHNGRTHCVQDFHIYHI